MRPGLAGNRLGRLHQRDHVVARRPVALAQSKRLGAVARDRGDERAAAQLDSRFGHQLAEQNVGDRADLGHDREGRPASVRISRRVLRMPVRRRAGRAASPLL